MRHDKRAKVAQFSAVGRGHPLPTPYHTRGLSHLPLSPLGKILRVPMSPRKISAIATIQGMTLNGLRCLAKVFAIRALF